jgi:hypothetical protein
MTPCFTMHALTYNLPTYLSPTYLLLSSVAWAISPNVNTFFNFHIFQIEFLKIQQCQHTEGLTDFSFQTQFVSICFNFQQKYLLENQYLLYLSFEICEINSIKSN